MEVLRFPGYTAIEKFQIAKRHLLPRAMEKNGITADTLTVTDEALESVISDYTMEAGVRSLKNRIDTLCRTAAVKIVSGDGEKIRIEAKDLRDLHVHVPAGAVLKDGPSAGITLTTALASLVTGTPVCPEYAMTGEVSLRGAVMPIGGLPEKLMAAQRAGVKQVFIPEENVEDLKEVAEEVKQALRIVPVHWVTEVWQQAGIPFSE